MKKVKIIGAGLSGLSVGCYLQMNGYNTEIFEKHSIPGGLCTSWTRGGYQFDGCIHWLLGSGKGNSFYKFWSELIDMKKMEFVNHLYRVSIEVEKNSDKFGNKIFYLYSNTDKLQDYLLNLSPEDVKPIREFIESIKYLQRQDELPPLADKAPEVRTFSDYLKLVKYIPLLRYLSKWNKITNVSFAEKLKSPFLKEAFELIYEGQEHTLLMMIMQLAFYGKGCAGYPVGGSYAFAKQIEGRYFQLGGSIRYNTGISKIITKQNTAVGIQAEDGMTYDADIVISAADWYFTVFQALGGNYINRGILALKDEKTYDVFYSVFLISLGISGTFDNIPYLFRFPLTEVLKLEDGSEFTRMEAHLYNYDRTLSPQGKTVITVTLTAKNADFWIKLRENDHLKYTKIKNALAEKVIDQLDYKLEHIKDSVEVIDVATPATFYRYTGNWKGSIQGWMPKESLFAATPVKNTLPGLKNFYMTGHWMQPGGGVPIALLTGRNLAQVICKQDGKKFETIEKV